MEWLLIQSLTVFWGFFAKSLGHDEIKDTLTQETKIDGTYVTSFDLLLNNKRTFCNGNNIGKYSRYQF